VQLVPEKLNVTGEIMAVTEEMILLGEWERDRLKCRLLKNGLCSYWSTKTECNVKNCLRVPETQKA
jgi:hypothetical protein